MKARRTVIENREGEGGVKETILDISSIAPRTAGEGEGEGERIAEETKPQNGVNRLSRADWPRISFWMMVATSVHVLKWNMPKIGQA